MPRSRFLAALVLTAVLAASCAGEGDGAAPAPELAVERLEGYAVVVDQTGGRVLIGLSADRNATSGESYDVTQAVWRVEAGDWNEPPVACLAVGKRVELGIVKVQNVAQPGLLKSRVIWISCLTPAD